MASKQDSTNSNQLEANDDSMTVQEAGHRGGERVRELINEGKEKEDATNNADDSSKHSAHFGEKLKDGDQSDSRES